jgi:hypothetical protein
MSMALYTHMEEELAQHQRGQDRLSQQKRRTHVAVAVPTLQRLWVGRCFPHILCLAEIDYQAVATARGISLKSATLSDLVWVGLLTSSASSPGGYDRAPPSTFQRLVGANDTFRDPPRALQ